MEKNQKLAQNKPLIANEDSNTSFFELANTLLGVIPSRSQEIIKKRFGLSQEKLETLEKIGNDYGITRERVRQIISDAVKKIAKRKDEAAFKKAEERIIFTITKNGGIIKEESILEKLGAKDFREENSIKFFGICSDKIIIEEENFFKKSWILSADILKKVEEIGEIAKMVLEKKNETLTDKELVAGILAEGVTISGEQTLSYVSSINEIEKNKFNKWGLSKWMEVNPKGTRERIYLILKEQGQPLHFTEIAKQIDRYHLGKRKSHPQTVHNELIKDTRFVLIGRGIYALKEWGYTKGTIKDVLANILEKAGRPMSKEGILQEVMKIRQVKKTTIMINLNNANYFVKKDNLYTVKK